MIIEVQHQAPEDLEVQKTAGASQVQTIDRRWTSLVTRSHQLRFRENVPVVMQRQDTTIQMIQKIEQNCGDARCDAETLIDDSMTFKAAVGTGAKQAAGPKKQAVGPCCLPSWPRCLPSWPPLPALLAPRCRQQAGSSKKAKGCSSKAKAAASNTSINYSINTSNTKQEHKQSNTSNNKSSTKSNIRSIDNENRTRSNKLHEQHTRGKSNKSGTTEDATAVALT